MFLLTLHLLVTLFVLKSLTDECTVSRTSRRYLNKTFVNSDVLLSGTVDRIIVITDQTDTVQRWQIHIRRIFKGKAYVGSQSSVNVTVPSKFKLCMKSLLLHDTRIFPLSSKKNQLTLSSPLIHINIGVLDSFHSFIWGKPHRKRKKAKKSFCESNLCPIGSKCVHSTGKCECRTICRSNGSAVCGTDRISYASACHLQVKACLLSKKGITLRVADNEACRKKSPCDDLRCGPGEDCLVSEKNNVLSAQCVCPTSCPSYGNSVESSPVCSSQGLDYPSLCHLKQHACTTQTNITVKYFGECNPCAAIDCARGTRCKLNSNRRPECRCSEQCPLHYDPICANNGLTYTNECVMNVAACKEDIELSVYKKGKCSDVGNPCDNLNCPRYSQCHIHENGTAICRCPQTCPLAMTPVCGTDDVTYDNECEVQKHACLQRTHIAVRHQGSCGVGLCASYICHRPLVCMMINGKPSCVCPKCTDELREVCASDGRTYANECKMRKAACEMGITLFVKYNGICSM